MERGIIQLFPAFNGSTDTTKEEMEAYVKEAAGRLCELAGLAIIEAATIRHDHGAVYVLGEQGEGQGIIAVGNYDNASVYHKLVFIGRVYAGNAINQAYKTASIFNTSEGVAFNLQQAAGWSVYMKYAMDQDTVLFGLTNGASASLSYACNYCITTFEHDGMRQKMFMVYYSNSAYASYDRLLDNEVVNTVLFAINNSYAPLVPVDKEALADICLPDVALPSVKLFTNKKGMAAWSILSINGEKYAVMINGSSWTVLVKMKASTSGEA